MKKKRERICRDETTVIFMRVYSNIQPHHVTKVINDATNYMKSAGGNTERNREFDRAIAE